MTFNYQPSKSTTIGILLSTFLVLRMSTAFIGGAVVVEVVVVVVVVVLVVEVVVVVVVVVVLVVEVVVEVVVVEAVVVGVVVGDVVIGAVEVLSGFIVVVSEWLLDKPAASPIIKHIRTPANALNRISFDDHVRLCFKLTETDNTNILSQPFYNSFD